MSKIITDRKTIRVVLYNGATWILDPKITHPDNEKVFLFNSDRHRMEEHKKIDFGQSFSDYDKSSRERVIDIYLGWYLVSGISFLEEWNSALVKKKRLRERQAKRKSKLIRLESPYEYLSAWGRRAGLSTPERERQHDLIISIKNLNDEEALETAVQALWSIMTNLDDEIEGVVCVPSGTVNKVETGVKIVGRRLANRMRIKDWVNCLQRNEGVSRGADKARHIQTITLVDQDHIKNKCVLLLDDVSTTGATLAACDELVMQANPSILYSITLAKTLSADAL